MKLRVNTGTETTPVWTVVDAEDATTLGGKTLAQAQDLTGRVDTTSGLSLTSGKVSASTLKTSIGTLSTLKTTAKTSVVASINELFQNVSDGKVTVASAITDKGQSVSGTATFDQLATAISNLKTGGLFAGDTVNESDLEIVSANQQSVFSVKMGSDYYYGMATLPDDSFYLAHADNSFYYISASGTKIWSKEAGSSDCKVAAVDSKGNGYAGYQMNASVKKFDKAGNMTVITLPDVSYANVCAISINQATDDVYIATEDSVSNLVKANSSNQIVWRTALDKSAYNTIKDMSFATMNGVKYVYAITANNYLACFVDSGSTVALQWVASISDIGSVSRIHADPVHGKVYISTGNNGVAQYNANSPIKNWFVTGLPSSGYALTGDPQGFIYVCGGGTMVKMNHEGVALWSHNVGSYHSVYEIAVTPITNKVIIADSSDYYLKCVRRNIQYRIK